MQFGGMKANDDYLVLLRAINRYLGRDEAWKGLALMQTYGELMYSETVSFRERYDFEVEEYVTWQVETCRSLGIERLLA